MACVPHGHNELVEFAGYSLRAEFEKFPWETIWAGGFVIFQAFAGLVDFREGWNIVQLVDGWKFRKVVEK